MTPPEVGLFALPPAPADAVLPAEPFDRVVPAAFTEFTAVNAPPEEDELPVAPSSLQPIAAKLAAPTQATQDVKAKELQRRDFAVLHRLETEAWWQLVVLFMVFLGRTVVVLARNESATNGWLFPAGCRRNPGL